MYIKESQLFYCFVYVLYCFIYVISWVSPCQVWWTPTWKDWPALGNLSLVELVAKMPVGTSIGGCTGLERLSKFISPRWRSLETSKRGTNLGGKSTRIRWWCTLLSIYLVGWRLLCKPSPISSWVDTVLWTITFGWKCLVTFGNIFEVCAHLIQYIPKQKQRDHVRSLLQFTVMKAEDCPRSLWWWLVSKSWSQAPGQKTWAAHSALEHVGGHFAGFASSQARGTYIRNRCFFLV